MLFFVTCIDYITWVFFKDCKLCTPHKICLATLIIYLGRLEKVICYDLRLGSGCNSGKDLRKNGEDVQLVKCKEYKAVSMLYIIMLHEKSVHSI